MKLLTRRLSLRRTYTPSALELTALIGLVCAIFVADILTPLGIAVWLLYVLPVWYASHLPRGGHLAAITAIGCSILIGVAYAVSPEIGYPIFIVASNRSLGIALLSITAVIFVRSNQRKDALQRQATLLQEHAILLDRAHVMVRGLDGRIITWTRGLEQLYGWSKAEAIGRVNYALLRTRFIVPRTDCEARLLQTGEWSGELVQTRKDGSAVTVASHWVLHRDAAGRPAAVLEINNDITELKRTQEALRESGKRLELALNASQLGTWDVDLATGAMIESSQRSCMFGLPPGTSIQSLDDWRTRVHPDDVETVLKQFWEAMRTGKPYDAEYRVVWRDSSLHWIASKGMVVRDENGKPVRATGVSYDITSHKLAEEEIRRLLTEAEARERELRDKQEQLVQSAKLAGLGELATGVAHELNNPLNNIGLFIGNALDRLRAVSPDISTVTVELERSLSQVKKAATIITHLRTFGRMAPRDREAVSLNELVTSALSLIHEQFRLREIVIQVELAPSEPTVMGNRIQLEQVLLNLLTNARDAVEGAEQKTITIRTGLATEEAELEVRDTGHGIPDEEQPRLFDPFFTTKEVGQGTGLGLSITYGIIREHRGQIAVESHTGRGASFLIRLPAVSPLVSRRPANPLFSKEKVHHSLPVERPIHADAE